MSFNVNNLIVDDILSATMFTKSGEQVLFGLNDISDPSLELGGNLVYATDHLGFNIAAFAREKTANFSGSNSTVSIDLLSAQMGGAKEIASASNKITSPFREVIQIGGTEGTANTTISLKKTPVAGTLVLELLGSDRTPMNVNIPIESGSSATAASLAGTTVTLPTGMSLTAEDFIGAYYDYETASAVTSTALLDAGVVSGKFEVEVLFADKCDQSKLYYGFIVFPSAVLDSTATLDLTVEGKHPFTVSATAEYCGDTRELFHIVVPES